MTADEINSHFLGKLKIYQKYYQKYYPFQCVKECEPVRE